MTRLLLLAGAVSGTVSILINEVPFPVPMEKLSQCTQPTSPDPPSQAGSGAGLLGQLGCIQGQRVVQELVLFCSLDHASSVSRSTE